MTETPRVRIPAERHHVGDFLLSKRTLYVYGEIGEEGEDVYVPASFILQSLMMLDAISNDPIKLVINSPGGEVYTTFALYDCMMAMESPIVTVATGFVASGAAVLLAAGTKGMRIATPNTTIMIHTTWATAGTGGDATDMSIEAAEMRDVTTKLRDILSEHTGQKKGTITRHTKKDKYFSPEEALEYGLIDRIGGFRLEGGLGPVVESEDQDG